MITSKKTEILTKLDTLYNTIETQKMLSCLSGNNHIYAALNLLKFWFKGGTEKEGKALAQDMLKALREVGLL